MYLHLGVKRREPIAFKLELLVDILELIEQAGGCPLDHLVKIGRVRLSDRKAGPMRRDSDLGAPPPLDIIDEPVKFGLGACMLDAGSEVIGLETTETKRGPDILQANRNELILFYGEIALLADVLTYRRVLCPATQDTWRVLKRFG